MKIVAVSPKGKEYIYNFTTAHEVSKASAEKICKCLNDHKFRIRDDQVWAIHDADRYDNGYYYAEDQKFRVYKGQVREYTRARFR